MSTGRGRRDLLVALAQWLPVPGEHDMNLESAMGWIEKAGAAGADLVVLPELWPSGYDTSTLKENVLAAAEPLPGPRSEKLGALARQLAIWVFAGSVPEWDGELIYNTAIVLDREGALVARHRKIHLYSPTGEDKIFAAGSSLTTFVDEELGNVGLTVCFDGDFPETARSLGARGSDLVVQVNAYEKEAESYWDLLYPAAALANGQWWLLANQCGSTKTGTLLGASRVISPAGEIVAQAQRAGLGETPLAELLLCRMGESSETESARGFAQLLRVG